MSIPCLAKGFSAGKFIDLALAYSLSFGREPEVTCRFKLDECSGPRRDFMGACPNALAASTACRVTDRWFTPHISVLAEFGIRQWTAEVSTLSVSQPLWPAWWVDTPDRSSSSNSQVVQDNLGYLLGGAWSSSSPILFTLFELLSIGVVWMIFWDAWSAGAEAGLLRAHHRSGGPVASGIQAFLGRGWLRIRTRHFKDGVQGCVPQSVFTLGNGVSSVVACFSTALDIEEVLSGAGGDQLHVMVAVVIESFDTVDRSPLIVLWGVLGCLLGLGRKILLTIIKFVFGLSWPQVWVSLGVGMEASRKRAL